MKIINIDNITNIRDISYGDIKEKKLIRSSQLNKVTQEDINILKDEYNLKTIIDLRTQKEVNKYPYQIDNVNYIRVPLVEDDMGITHGNTIEEKVLSMKENMFDLEGLYIDLLTRDKKDKWTQIFNIFLDNKDGSILWHCKVGKDRCGMVSAMILLALGIDEKTVIDDYLLTNNETIIKEAQEMYDIAYKLTQDINFSNKLKDSFLAKEEFLLSAMSFISNEYQSIDNFLYEMCGLTKEKREILKSIYLK